MKGCDGRRCGKGGRNSWEFLSIWFEEFLGIPNEFLGIHGMELRQRWEKVQKDGRNSWSTRFEEFLGIPDEFLGIHGMELRKDGRSCGKDGRNS